MNKDIELKIKKYQKIKEELNNKIKRIKNAFVDGVIKANDFKKELRGLEQELSNVDLRLKELENLKQSNEHKQDVELIFNIKEIEKLKLKSEYVKEHNLWNKLTQIQKQYIINKYVDEIEISADKNHNISIINIIFNKNESDFDFDCLGKKPTVLYCCIPDESKIYYSLISIVVSLIYKTLVLLCNEQKNTI